MSAMAMDGYGAYVWTSFALTFVVVIFACQQSRAHHKKVMVELKTRIMAMEEQS